MIVDTDDEDDVAIPAKKQKVRPLLLLEYIPVQWIVQGSTMGGTLWDERLGRVCGWQCVMVSSSSDVARPV